MSEAYTFSRKNRTVWWPVSINVPQDGGEVTNITISMQLSVPKKDEAKASTDLPDKEFIEYMQQRVLDWDGVQDEDGKPIPFSKEVFVELLRDRFFELGVSKALLLAASGVRAKN